MDKWTRTQDLVEELFGKRPDSPEMLVEYMRIMADMIIEEKEIGEHKQASHTPLRLRN